MQRSRELLALAVTGITLFLLVSVLTYHEDLPPAKAPAGHNLCGSVGFLAARFLLHYFGWASLVFVVALGTEAVRLWRGSQTRTLQEKLPGLVLFVVVLAGVFYEDHFTLLLVATVMIYMIAALGLTEESAP